MFCPNCGTKIDDDAKFCQSCGYKLANEPENTDKYVRPEKVRFSERWLLLKVFVIHFFILGFYMWTLEDGIDAVLYESDWVELISGIILLFLFNYFLTRNLRMYAGNPYMLNFPIKDSTLLFSTKIIHYAGKCPEFLTAVFVVIRAISNARSYGFLSVYTWMEAIQSSEGWIVLTELLWLVESMLIAFRSFTWWEKNAGFDGIWEDSGNNKDDQNS